MQLRLTGALCGWVGRRQIEKDLLRTMPSNACFANVSSIGVPRLRRVLRALAWLYPEIGYCQGTGMVSTAQKGQGVFARPLRVNSAIQGSRMGGGARGGNPTAGWGCHTRWFHPRRARVRHGTSGVGAGDLF